MSENDFDDLEREIAAMRPKGMPPGVVDRLTMEMNAVPRTPWADRCLLGAIGMGLAASVVIVSMLWVQSATAPSPGPTNAGAMMAHGGNDQRAGDYVILFARVDGGHWGEIVK